MTCGIVDDDTAHLLSKYLRARRERGMQPEAAVRYAIKTAGRAPIFTAIVLLAGFLVLATSHTGLNSTMRTSVAIVIACALATVWLFRPPVLIRIEGGSARRRRRTGSTPGIRGRLHAMMAGAMDCSGR
jgi:hypothetical protein